MTFILVMMFISFRWSWTSLCIDCMHLMSLNKIKLIQTHILNGHYSHIQKLEVINLAWEDHVDIICLPLHNSHKMQRLDKAFMGFLKTFYSQEIII
jgi:diacylglycerol kinase